MVVITKVEEIGLLFTEEPVPQSYKAGQQWGVAQCKDLMLLCTLPWLGIGTNVQKSAASVRRDNCKDYIFMRSPGRLNNRIVDHN